jgi:hypothetical protein
MNPIRRGLAPLPPKLRMLTDDIAFIPPGYGFRPLGLGEMLERAQVGELLNVFQIWEPPLRGERYILGGDVSDGLGQDRSVCDVLRMGTLERPEEQVAQFISDTVKPREFAFVIDAIGRYYCDDDGLEALAAIETNNHGLSTQDTLQLHLGYSHFYRWEYLDSMDPASRYTSRIGWFTTNRTRPMLLDHFHEALTTFDPITGLPDLRINSPWTLGELGDFQTEGALWEARAAAGAHDDCIIALAIAHYVAWRLVGGEREPLQERRRRRHHMEARRERLDQDKAAARDFRNMAYTEQEAAVANTGEATDEEQEAEELYDVRGVVYDYLEYER